MQKYIIGGIVIVILLAAGYLVWQNASRVPAQEPESQVQLPAVHTYASSTFSIVYPDRYTVNENYKYEGVPKKSISGVSFLIPEAMTTGTNLSASDTGVSVEQLPRAQKCTGDIFIYENVKAADLTIGSKTFSMASTSGAAAGNLFEERVFAVKGSHPCTAVRYFIHSTNIGNYGTSTPVREFDHAKLLADFGKIRDSLELNQ